MDAFAALADPVRRELLEELASGPARVTDLARRHPISRPAISRHLRVLAAAGLVDVEERGRERHFSLRAEGLTPVSALLRRLALGGAPVTERSLDALDTEVRRTSRDRRRHPRPQPAARREDTA